MDFDINTVRSIFTVLVFVAFIGVWIWAWSSKRKPDFDEAANLPFAEDDNPVRTGVRAGNKKESTHG